MQYFSPIYLFAISLSISSASVLESVARHYLFLASIYVMSSCGLLLS